ncbi:hypothetical protein PIB30_074967 [Stylosanthes scabra]|uniref:Uncharacterized protein n=1 Tax=Stylosanthes scabra TaxID=79078 RepID=A0ABU6TPF8_9FABA|nr:hypothetical protein [Stylosanthes scabra]
MVMVEVVTTTPSGRLISHTRPPIDEPFAPTRSSRDPLRFYPSSNSCEFFDTLDDIGVFSFIDELYDDNFATEQKMRNCTVEIDEARSRFMYNLVGIDSELHRVDSREANPSFLSLRESTPGLQSRLS